MQIYVLKGKLASTASITSRESDEYLPSLDQQTHQMSTSRTKHMGKRNDKLGNELHSNID